MTMCLIFIYLCNLLKVSFFVFLNRGPQCLRFSKITHLLKSSIYWLDSKRLSAQRILMKMEKMSKTHTHASHTHTYITHQTHTHASHRERNRTWEKVSWCSLVISLFLEQPPILPTPPYLWEILKPLFLGKFRKLEFLPLQKIFQLWW